MRRIVRTQTHKGKIKNATALEVDGIKFKSKLELFTYNKLIENNIKDFKYEEVKFTLLEGFEFNNKSIEMFEKTENKYKQKHFEDVSSAIRPITYLPDFTHINDDKTGWIIEVKGYANDALIRRALN